MTSLIKQINFPSDLRKFKKDQLKKISDELRNELIDVVSETTSINSSLNSSDIFFNSFFLNLLKSEGKLICLINLVIKNFYLK